MRLLSRSLALLVFLGMAAASQAAPSKETLEIVTTTGSHPFEVEVVRSPPDMEKGLMFRRYMPEDRGMLFDFKKPQPVMMWMKNTYLPLDMVFIDGAGKVINVAEHAEPLSEAIIPSGGPAVGVLEVNAGVAAKIGLKRGDRVRASIFSK